MSSLRFRQSSEKVAAKTHIHLLKKGKVKKGKSDGTLFHSSELNFANKNGISQQESNQSASSSGSKKQNIHIISSAKNVSTKSLVSLLSNQDSLITRSSSKQSFNSKSEEKSPRNPVKPLPQLLPKVAKKLNENYQKTIVKRLGEKRDLKHVHSRKPNPANNTLVALDAKSSTEDKLRAKASKTELPVSKHPSRKSKTKIPQRIDNKAKTAKSVSPQRSRGRNVILTETSKKINSKVIGSINKRNLSGGSTVSRPRELITIQSEQTSRNSQDREYVQEHPHTSSSDLPFYANSKKRVLSFSETKTPYSSGSKRRKTSIPSINENAQQKPINAVQQKMSKSNQKSDVKIKADGSRGSQSRLNKKTIVASGKQLKSRRNDSSGRMPEDISSRSLVETNSSKRSKSKANRSLNQGVLCFSGEKETSLTRLQHNRSTNKNLGNFETSFGNKVEGKLKGQHSQSSRSDISKLASDLQTISTHLKEASKKRHSLKNAASTKEESKRAKVKSISVKSKTKHFSQSALQRCDQTINAPNGSETTPNTTGQTRKYKETYTKTKTTPKRHLLTVTSTAKDKNRSLRNANLATEDVLNEVTLRKADNLTKTSMQQSTKKAAISKKDNSASKRYLGKAKISKKNVSLSKYVESSKSQKRSLRLQSSYFNRNSTHKSSNIIDNNLSAFESERRLFNSKKSRSRRDFVRQKTTKRYVSAHKKKLTRKTKSSKTPSIIGGFLESQSLVDRLVTETRTSTQKSKCDKPNATPTESIKVLSDKPMISTRIKYRGKTSTPPPQSNKKSSPNKIVTEDKAVFCFSHLSPKLGTRLPLNASFVNELTQLSSTSRIRNSTTATTTKVTASSSPPSGSKIVHQTTSELSLQSKTSSRKQVEKTSPETSTTSSLIRKSQKAAAPRFAADVTKQDRACKKSLFHSPRKNIAQKRSTRSPNISTFAEAFQNTISPSLRKTFKHKYVQVSSIPSMLNIQKLVSKLPNCISILTQVRDTFHKAEVDICTFTEIISIDDLLTSAVCNTEYDESFNDHSSMETERLHELCLKSGKVINMVDKKVSYSPFRGKRHNRRKTNENPGQYKLSPPRPNVLTTAVALQKTNTDGVYNDGDIENILTSEDCDEGENEVQADDSDNEIFFNLKKSASPKDPEESNKSVFTQTIEVEVNEIKSTPKPILSPGLASGNNFESVKNVPNTDKVLTGNCDTETISSKEDAPKTNAQDLASNQTSPWKGASNKTLVENVRESSVDSLSTYKENKEKTHVDAQVNVTKVEKKLLPNNCDWLPFQKSVSSKDKALSAKSKNKLSTSTKLNKSHKLKPKSKSKKKKKPMRKKKDNPVIKARRIKKSDLPYVFKSSIDYSENDSEDDATDDTVKDDINYSEVDSKKFNGIDILDPVDEHDIFLLSSYKGKRSSNTESPIKVTNTPDLKQQATVPCSDAEDPYSTRLSSRKSSNLRQGKQKDQHQITPVKTTSPLNKTTPDGSLHESKNTTETSRHNFPQLLRALELSPLSKKDNSNLSQNQTVSSAVQPKMKTRNSTSKSRANVDQRSSMTSILEPKSSRNTALDRKSSNAFSRLSDILDNKTRNSTTKISGPLIVQANARVTRLNPSSLDETNQSREFNSKKSKSLTAIDELTWPQNETSLMLKNKPSPAYGKKINIDCISAAEKITQMQMSGKGHRSKSSKVSSNIGLDTSLPSHIVTPKQSIQEYSDSTKSSPRKKTDVSNYQKSAVMALTKSARATRSSKSIAVIASLSRGTSPNINISLADRPTMKELKSNQAIKSRKDSIYDKRHESANRKTRNISLTQKQNVYKTTAKNKSPKQKSERPVGTVRGLGADVKLYNVDWHLRKSVLNADDSDVHMHSDLNDSNITQTANVTKQSPRKHNVHKRRKHISLVLSQLNYVNLKGYKKCRYLLRARRKKIRADFPNSVRKGANFMNIDKEQLRLHSRRSKAQDRKIKYSSSEFMRRNSTTTSKDKKIKQKENNVFFHTANTKEAKTFYFEKSPEVSKKNIRFQKMSPGKLAGSSKYTTAELKSMPTPEFSSLSESVQRKCSKMTKCKPTGKVQNIRESFSNLEDLKRTSKRNITFKQNVENGNKLKDSKYKRRLQKINGLDKKLKQEISKPCSVLHSTPYKSLTTDSDITYSTRSMRKFGKIAQLQDQTNTKIRVVKKLIEPNPDMSPKYSQNNLPVFLITEPTPMKRHGVSSFTIGGKFHGTRQFLTSASRTKSDNEDKGIKNDFSPESAGPFSYVRRHSAPWSDDWAPSSEYGRRMLRVLDRKEVLASPLRKKVEGGTLSSTNLADDSNISEFYKTDFEDAYNGYINLSSDNSALEDSSLKYQEFPEQEEKKAALKNVRFKFNPSDSCIIL